MKIFNILSLIALSAAVKIDNNEGRIIYTGNIEDFLSENPVTIGEIPKGPEGTGDIKAKRKPKSLQDIIGKVLSK